MSATYDYNTGKITIDFKFVKGGERCQHSQLPSLVNSQWCRTYCNYYIGTIYGRDIFEEPYVQCKHPSAIDSADCGEARSKYYEQLETRALDALCY